MYVWRMTYVLRVRLSDAHMGTWVMGNRMLLRLREILALHSVHVHHKRGSQKKRMQAFHMLSLATIPLCYCYPTDPTPVTSSYCEGGLWNWLGLVTVTDHLCVTNCWGCWDLMDYVVARLPSLRCGAWEDNHLEKFNNLSGLVRKDKHLLGAAWFKHALYKHLCTFIAKQIILNARLTPRNG